MQGGLPGTAAGARITAIDCGRTRTNQRGWNESSSWAARGGTIASLQPGTPFCFGIAPNKSGAWDPASAAMGGRAIQTLRSVFFFYAITIDIHFKGV